MGGFISPDGEIAGLGGIFSYANGLCFVAGTAILTSTGLVAIEDISVGDEVWSENLKQEKRN